MHRGQSIINDAFEVSFQVYIGLRRGSAATGGTATICASSVEELQAPFGTASTSVPPALLFDAIG